MAPEQSQEEPEKSLDSREWDPESSAQGFMSATKKIKPGLQDLAFFSGTQQQLFFFQYRVRNFKSRDDAAVPCKSIWFKFGLLLVAYVATYSLRKARHFRYPDFPGCIPIPIRQVIILPLTLARGHPCQIRYSVQNSSKSPSGSHRDFQKEPLQQWAFAYPACNRSHTH